MGTQSSCRVLVLVVLGCVLPTILAAPSNAGLDQGQNDLAHRSGKDDLNELNETGAADGFVAKYGCLVTRAAAGICNTVRNGAIDDNGLILGRSVDDDMDQLDMNQIHKIVKKYGCVVLRDAVKICNDDKFWPLLLLLG